MVLMLLLATPAFAKPVAHAAVSLGWQALPSLSPELKSSMGAGFSRIELGVGPKSLQVYGVLQIALHNGEMWQNSAALGTVPSVLGDTSFTNVGAGARLPIALGSFHLVPHVDLGGAFSTTPMDKTAYQTDVLPYYGRPPALGLHSAGPWAQGGLDAGYTVIPDAVDLFIAGDAGIMMTGGVQPVLDARLGLSGRF